MIDMVTAFEVIKTAVSVAATIVVVGSAFKKGDVAITEKLQLDNGKWYPGKRIVRLWRGGGRALRGFRLP